MADFLNKTIIVTGGAQGIGQGIVKHLLNNQARVVVADIDREAGEELMQELTMPEKVFYVTTDGGMTKKMIYVD